MGGTHCCRSGGEDLLQERQSDLILAGLHDERVRRKIQQIEELAFVTSSLGAADDAGEDPEGDEALFLDVIERLEKGDEFESNSVGGRSLDGSDSETDSVSGDSPYGQSVREESDGELDAGLAQEDAPLADWELVAAWNELRQREVPKPSVAARLIRSVAQLYSTGPSLVALGDPPPNGRYVIVGDLHGHFGDLFHLLDAFGEPSAGPGGTQYLFNGDFVDRGTWGPEVLLTLYCLKLRHPGAVHFNRGNHEDVKQNRMPANGFRDRHCTRAFPREGAMMYGLCLTSFGQLPLCHVLGGQIAVVHGGLPLDPDVKLEEIERVHRQRGVPSHKYLVHGYRTGQRVKARREMLTGLRQPVPEGSLGRLARRYKRTAKAMVYFDEWPEDAALVTIRGAPELEDEVEIVFDSEEDREAQRNDRIFISLMWSDPIGSTKSSSSSSSGPNTKRGAGYWFDKKVTQAFLHANGLRCLVRSHEKQESGSSVVQRADDGSLLAVTVFSASNYPAGAGEPSGNKAGVVVVKLVGSDGEMSLAVTSSVNWREPFVDMPRWTKSRMRKSFCHRTRQSSESSEGSERRTARQQALQQLWLLVYCARPALLKYFNTHDKDLRGRATLEEWVSAMRACVISEEDFPWEQLGRHLAHFGAEGCCNYGAFLQRFHNVLSRRLEARFCDGALLQALCSLGGNLAPEQEWLAMDSDGNGRLSYAEFRPLLRAHTGSFKGVSADADDDRAFALLASMDKNLSGFVEKEEFLHAMRRSTSEQAEFAPMSEEESATLHKCWAAVHAVLRALASSRFQADAIFHAMDTGNDGYLCRAEFRRGLEQVLHGSYVLSSLKDWEPLLWRLVDEDKSGKVSPEELEAALAVVDITQGTDAFGRLLSQRSPEMPSEEWPPEGAARGSRTLSRAARVASRRRPEVASGADRCRL